jgi:pSer/pThr/pTyr-binding forkhead associated (FHA) protein
MPVLQLDDQQFPLQAGATRIGTGTGAELVVPGYSSLDVEAVIESGLTPTIRRGDETAHVRVNGVLLGAEPSPLMHGDKIEIAGLELRYADDAKGGATQFVSASEIAALVGGTKRAGAARATSASGGRLVSLVDGKEYLVSSSGMVLGREAASDVVVAQTEVSRRHAEIAIGEQGYVLKDLSANGVFVNGDRVQGSHRLARADVIRVGTEEFRFYGDVVSVAPQGAPTPVFSTPPAAPAATRPVAIPVAVAVALEEAPRPVLGMLESVSDGPAKGTRFELRTALTHVGRGPANDVRLQDESVSETHAKLQRREDGWYVVDMGSTNGTYVGGARVIGERRLDGAPDVRFGGVKLRFTHAESADAVELDEKGTRAIPRMAPVTAHAAQKTPAMSAEPILEAPSQLVAGPGRGGVHPFIWIIVVAAIAGVAFFVLKGRA